MKYALESLVLVMAGAYAAMMVVWMHAPLVDVLPVTATMFLLPLLLVWLTRRFRVRLGARAEDTEGGRSRLYRGFRMPDGHVLTLLEHDMSADGSSSWRRPEDEPERINGLPARLVVLEDPGGKAVSHLSWTEGRRDLELWIDANVVRAPLRARLFALAAALPPSVPACPKEIPPKPMRFGADGEPVPAPAPASMSEEDVARRDPRKRPCR